MTDHFFIQCPKCGTRYNDLQDECPYCGESQSAADMVSQHEIAVESPIPNSHFVSDDALSNEASAESFGSYPPPEAFIPNNDPFPEDDFIDDVADDQLEEAYSEGYPENYEEVYYDDVLFPDHPIDVHNGPVGSYPPDAFFQADELADEFLSDEMVDEPEESLQPATRRFTWLQISLGCLGVLLCATFFYGGIGLVAVQQGLQERAQLAQSESQSHFQKGQILMQEDSVELAIAEFERALNLDPSFSEARQALREAQAVMQTQPTPTSRTRSAAAVDIFEQAEAEFAQNNWADAIQTLSEVQDLDPNYQPEKVSDMLYTANYQLGLQLLGPDQMDQTLAAFDQALEQRPDDPDVTIEQNKALLYVEAITALDYDLEAAIEMLEQLLREDNAYLDTPQLLAQSYEEYGDELLLSEDWCLANQQYIEANNLQSRRQLESKIERSEAQCNERRTPTSTKQATRAPAASRPTSTALAGVENAPTPFTTQSSADTGSTATAAIAEEAPASAGSPTGSILYSAYNTKELRWEILAAPVNGGTPSVVAINATMPSLSPNGQLLLYHSESGDSEGLHALNLVSGEDIRVTTVRDHLYPRWSNNLDLIFTSQEEATGRWQYFQAFGDGKSSEIILGDGRTADWSRNGQIIAYQGTDPRGNQPGIYRIPFGGGEAVRLTTHESDRSPAFSPDGSLVAYMSTQNGNWDIYTVPVSGGTPRQITTSPGNDGLPAWSPDASHIAYVSDAGGSWAIYVTKFDGGDLTRVSDWDGNRADWLVSQIWWQP